MLLQPVGSLDLILLSSNPQRHGRTSLHITGNLEIITKVQVFLFYYKARLRERAVGVSTGVEDQQSFNYCFVRLKVYVREDFLKSFHQAFFFFFIFRLSLCFRVERSVQVIAERFQLKPSSA